MNFFGREIELQILEEAYQSPKSQFFPVYGRRRVGKTEMVVHFMDQHPSLYFMGKETSEESQIREFLAAAAVELKKPFIARMGVDGWKDALELVIEHRPAGKKFILALDEFQWIVATTPALPSIIQQLWDQQWKKSGDIFLILCGSYLGFMEREVLGSKSPLYGRRTGQILLQPFTYREAARFHKGLSPTDLAATYFLCGGIPYYLELLERTDSIATSIRRHFLSPHALLAREPDFLLREELREVEKYYTLLMAIANGAPTAKKIAATSGLPDRSLYYYLQQLTDLGYIARHYPVTTRKPANRSVRFRIEDPVLRFWFRFVFPNQSLIRKDGPVKAYDRLIKPQLESYFGQCFERLCQEALPFLHTREKVEGNIAVGSFWNKDTQIDLVGVRDDHRIDLGECKWGSTRSYTALSTELEGKISRYTNPDNRTVQPRIFVKKKPPRAVIPEGYLIHDLTDIYK